MRGSVVAGVLSAGLFAGSALAQDAVQWRVEDGGNGHWYEARIRTTGVTWFQSRDLAIELGGQLTSLETPNERAFVFSGFSQPAAPSAWIPQVSGSTTLFGPWIGGEQAPGSAEPISGWSWLSGEPFDPTWSFGCCNNDCFGSSEDFLHLYRSDVTLEYSWNDLRDVVTCGAQPVSFIVEYSADCNSDGIVDFGQIRAGELDDANANNIPDCCEQGVACDCPADIDESGTVDAIDLAIVIGYWGTDGGKQYPQADIDGSGEIDGADLATLLGSWGACE